MGVSQSYVLPKHFAGFTHWPYPRVTSTIKAYETGEYDFGIDHTVIMTLTNGSLDEAKILLKAFTRNESGVANACVFFSALIMLAEPNRRQELYQVGTIFDFFDFDKTGQLSMDEFTIMISCLCLAAALILDRTDEVMDDNAVMQLVKAIYNKTGKVNGAPINRTEVLGISKEYFDSHEIKTVDEYFGRLTLGGDCLEWKQDDESTQAKSTNKE